MRLILLVLGIVLFASCGGDSENDASNPLVQNSEKMYVDTYAELTGITICNEKLYRQTAYVVELNLDFVCLFDEADGIWKWMALQNATDMPPVFSSSSIISSSEPNGNSSSSVYLSSSYEMSSSSAKANWVYLNPAISYGEYSDYFETYKTVTIGSQTWMAENMNYYSGCRRYSPKILEIDDGCYYSWSDAKKVCPQGWHLPSEADFKVLLNNVSSAQQLSSKKWKSEKNSFEGSDDFGFSVIPVGITTTDRLITGEWTINGETSWTQFWTSDALDAGSDSAWAFLINFKLMKISRAARSWGLSVRCLKD